jgi:hypothetical protein
MLKWRFQIVGFFINVDEENMKVTGTFINRKVLSGLSPDAKEAIEHDLCIIHLV